MTSPPFRVVVTDANVLINLMHVARLELLAELPDLERTVASDEKRRFRREAVSRPGKDRIIGTADLFVLAINAGLITLEEADEDKAMLEDRRFRMPFSSFREMTSVAPGISGGGGTLNKLPPNRADRLNTHTRSQFSDSKPVRAPPSWASACCRRARTSTGRFRERDPMGGQRRDDV